jgi:hypothetical protein
MSREGSYMAYNQHNIDALRYAGLYSNDDPEEPFCIPWFNCGSHYRPRYGIMPAYWAGGSKKAVDDAYDLDMKRFWAWEREHRPFHRTLPDLMTGPDIPEMEKYHGRDDMSTEHIRRYPTESVKEGKTPGGQMCDAWDKKYGNVPWELIPMHPYDVVRLAELDKICGSRQLSEAESKALKLFYEYQGVKAPKHPYEVAQQVCDEEDKNMSDGISDARRAQQLSLNPIELGEGTPAGIADVQSQSVQGLNKLATLMDCISLSVAGGHDSAGSCEDEKAKSAYKPGILDRSKGINNSIQDLIAKAEHIMQFL